MELIMEFSCRGLFFLFYLTQVPSSLGYARERLSSFARGDAQCVHTGVSVVARHSLWVWWGRCWDCQIRFCDCHPWPQSAKAGGGGSQERASQKHSLPVCAFELHCWRCPHSCCHFCARCTCCNDRVACRSGWPALSPQRVVCQEGVPS